MPSTSRRRGPPRLDPETDPMEEKQEPKNAPDNVYESKGTAKGDPFDDDYEEDFDYAQSWPFNDTGVKKEAPKRKSEESDEFIPEKKVALEDVSKKSDEETTNETAIVISQPKSVTGFEKFLLIEQQLQAQNQEIMKEAMAANRENTIARFNAAKKCYFNGK